MTAFWGSPEEIKQHAIRQKMEAEEQHNRLHQVIEEMTVEQLKTLGEYFTALLSADVYSMHASIGYMRGMVGMVLRIKHGKCICGEDHTGEMLAHEHAAYQREVLSRPVSSDEVTAYMTSNPQPPAHDVEAVAAAEANRAALYQEYGVAPVLDSTSNAVYCVKCGMPYVNLRDRMLRRPDECSGCFQKASHG